jgi:AbiV family abortive infection protein
MSAAGRRPRAYALAALAVEEAGKAGALSVLAVMPQTLRAQAPLGRLLEWHQLKLLGGLLITAVPLDGFSVKLAAMPPSQVAGILEDAQVLAQDVDRLKQRGLYADMDRSGRVTLPSEVTEADVAGQLGRARLAVSSASGVLVPGTAARIANPPAEAIEFTRALVSAFAQAGSGRSAEAAADVVLEACQEASRAVRGIRCQGVGMTDVGSAVVRWRQLATGRRAGRPWPSARTRLPGRRPAWPSARRACPRPVAGRCRPAWSRRLWPRRRR